MTIINIPKAADMKPGIYCVEVKRIASRTSSDGSPQIVLNLQDVASGLELCSDFVTFSPGNGTRIGRQKLKAFGLDVVDDKFDTDDLLYKRAYAAIKLDEYDGQPRLAVDIKQGAFCGYWHEKSPPEGAKPPAPELDVGSVPF